MSHRLVPDTDDKDCCGWFHMDTISLLLSETVDRTTRVMDVHTVQHKVNWRKIKILWEVSALEDIQVFDTTLGHQKVMEII